MHFQRTLAIASSRIPTDSAVVFLLLNLVKKLRKYWLDIYILVMSRAMKKNKIEVSFSILPELRCTDTGELQFIRKIGQMFPIGS